MQGDVKIYFSFDVTKCTAVTTEEPPGHYQTTFKRTKGAKNTSVTMHVYYQNASIYQFSYVLVCKRKKELKNTDRQYVTRTEDCVAPIPLELVFYWLQPNNDDLTN
eukprot:TRINITY_DN14456_c0_g1_i1.p1 TRINITY_DN14456_c0_g1~~TRINITY_DN14456_c0_g1_i1.p1  ORF type:complete len:106 (+),score=3.61 TRINITY_DN14456_c0_g1_i1:274-591(+)